MGRGRKVWASGLSLEGVLGGRSPLQNHEAEEALLGSMLSNGTAIDLVIGKIDAADFTVEAHGRIFDRLVKLREQGRSPDPITLKHAFDDDADLADVGGSDYLFKLAGSMIGVAVAVEYAHTIRDLAQRRRLAEAAIKIAERAVYGAEEAEAPEQIESALDKIAELNGHTIGPDGPRHISAVVSDVHAYWQAARDGNVKPTLTGLDDLDRMIGGMMPGDLWILGGRAAMGKSSAARSILGDLVENGRSAALFALEMNDIQNAMAMMQRHQPLDFARMRSGEMDDADMRMAMQASAALHKMPLFVEYDPGLTPAKLRRGIRAIKKQLAADHKPALSLVAVDYLQLFPSARKDGNRNLELAEITRSLKMIAGEEGVPILLLSQINRGVEAREDKRPTMSDLKDSGAIEQDADGVLIVYREEYYLKLKMPTGSAAHDGGAFAAWQDKMAAVANVAEIIVAKSRFGSTGVVRAHFDGARGRFTNAASPAAQRAYDDEDGPAF